MRLGLAIINENGRRATSGRRHTKVGFALRLDDSTLPPDIAEELPDFEFAFDQVTGGALHFIVYSAQLELFLP